MKKLIVLLFVFVFTAININAQCPDTIAVVNYRKVMSATFAKEYEKCPVIITGEFFKDGYVNNYKKPGKIKKMHFFQCININENGSPMPLTNEIAGDFFVIEKDKADKIFDLQKGDKVKVTGNTFVHNYWGTETVYFIVSDIEKETE